MHYKDIRGYNRSLNGYMDNVIELGRGLIDFPALHRILKSIRYKGWVTIDLDNARISPLESAKVRMLYISRSNHRTAFVWIFTYSGFHRAVITWPGAR
jgi:sugar phosphate isomerase/epimerase